MQEQLKKETFGKERASSYDQSNAALAPIHENLRYLIRILFSELPAQAKILSVGTGTGSELITLAQAYPQFTFVAADPSEAMLDVCRQRLKESDLLDRCELNHGFVKDLSEGQNVDAAICLLVGHHISNDEQRKLVREVANRLLPEGLFVNAEISFDTAGNDSENLLEKWKMIMRLMGAPDEKVQNLKQLFKEHLFVLPPKDVESLISENGFDRPVQFFQSLLMRAWYARKKSL